MTHVNARVPTSFELEERLQAKMLRTRAEWWEEQAKSLREELDNIFEHAKKTGSVEIHKNDEMLLLRVQE